MEEEIEMLLDEARDGNQKTLEHLATTLEKIRAGKATPSMLDSVVVEAYGATVPIQQVANVATLDAKTITVQPWDRSTIDAISTGIINANLGLNPQNNGEIIMLNVPMLTEERRRDLVKQAKAEAEDAKIGIRNARKDANTEIKKLEKEGTSEDDCKKAEEDVQKLTDAYIKKIEEHLVIKEAEIMKV